MAVVVLLVVAAADALRDPCLQQSTGASRPALLVISPHNSYRIYPFLAAAQRMGVVPLLVSEGKHALINATVAGFQVDFGSFEQAVQQILAGVEKSQILAVISTDDATVELAASVAASLGLPHNAVSAVRCARRKDLARQRLQAAGVAVPKHQVIDLRESILEQWRHGFPCVVKPLSMSASRGVIRANDPVALTAAVARVAAIVRSAASPFEQSHLLLEEYIEGDEYALEGVLQDGELQVLALFDKPEPLQGPFFEESYYITPSRLHNLLQRRLTSAVQQACLAYGLREGPIHAELRLDADGQPWILEVAARTIGGECARVLQFVLGLSLEELVIAHQLRQHIVPTDPVQDSAAGVLMIPIQEKGVLRRVEGIAAAQKIQYIEDVTISLREGYELIPLPEGNSYLGFIFARAPSVQQVECALRKAHACLRVITAPILNVQMR